MTNVPNQKKKIVVPEIIQITHEVFQKTLKDMRRKKRSLPSTQRKENEFLAKDMNLIL